jgi:hypothetical protein
LTEFFTAQLLEGWLREAPYLQFLPQRRGTANRHLERVKLIRDNGHLRDQKIDRGHGEEERDLIFLVISEEFGKVEFRHPVDDAAHVEGVDEVALHAGDVGGGEMG